jgi:hypothetical protein
MNRSRGGDDDGRRLMDLARGSNLMGTRNDDPVTASTPDLNPADWDDTPDPLPSTADRARSEADAAQAHSFFSHLSGDVQRILGGIAGFRELGADIRARLADAAARDAERAAAEAKRDKQIADRLIDPDQLARHAEAGGRQGAREALSSTTSELARQIAADAADRKADQADRRAHEARRHKHDTIRNGVTLGIALLIPTAFGLGIYIGNGTGDDAGYARARDEVAAASWANTTNGKLARNLDQAGQLTIPDMTTCPKGNGWHSEKRDGRRYCFPTNNDRKGIVGWAMP